jgi:hypothetical protein
MSLPPLSFIFLGWLIGFIFFYCSSSSHSRKKTKLFKLTFIFVRWGFLSLAQKNKCVLVTAFLIL